MLVNVTSNWLVVTWQLGFLDACGQNVDNVLSASITTLPVDMVTHPQQLWCSLLTTGILISLASAHTDYVMRLHNDDH